MAAGSPVQVSQLLLSGTGRSSCVDPEDHVSPSGQYPTLQQEYAQDHVQPRQPQKAHIQRGQAVTRLAVIHVLSIHPSGSRSPRSAVPQSFVMNRSKSRPSRGRVASRARPPPDAGGGRSPPTIAEYSRLAVAYVVSRSDRRHADRPVEESAEKPPVGPAVDDKMPRQRTTDQPITRFSAFS